MDRPEMPYEEYPLLPEYSIPPEFTPEYPDVSYFQESYVTAREENIFQGETPPGEPDPRVLRKEEHRKRARFSWLQKLLGSALRGGAALVALTSLIITIVSTADLPADSPWPHVKNKITRLQDDAFRRPDDYGPEDLAKLWNGDPAGPHQYNFEQVYVRREASCSADGLIEYICSECGVALPEIIPGGHTPAAAVKENIVGALCTDGGRYDSVVYCSVCRQELSRVTVLTEAIGHTAAEAVTENEKAPACTAEGSYDSVVYCSICHQELSRETVMTEATGHQPGSAEKENEQAPSCTAEGSYDSVISCMICGEELSRETVTLPMTDHIEAQDVIENHRDPGCLQDGSEEIVTYCDVCGAELARQQVVLNATGHVRGEAVVENETSPTCTAEGGYDTVVYCSNCGDELSRTHTVLAATGHTGGDPQEENRVAATCTAEGGYDTVIYCRTCGTEISRTHSILNQVAHTAAAAVRENEQAATCTAAGSYEDVVYCSVCHTELSRTGRSIAKTEHTPAAAVRENEQAATCTAAGSYENVVYCSVCRTELSRTAQTVAATGHDWGEPTYTWDPDYESVTATHVCRNDASHTESETAIPIGTVTTEASCTAAGVRTYTASFSNTALGTARKTEPIAALGHTFPVETWNRIYDDVTGERQSPVVVCDRCGTPALTISFVNANTINYTIDADFWEQASEALGFFEWGDCVAFEDESRAYGIGYVDSAYDEATSRTGTIVLDFTPVSGQTYYYYICLRVATSGSSDDVCFVAPSGGEKQTYTQP